jgi:hypothetical protein
MVKLNELDPEVSRIALARMLRRPVNPNAQGKAAKLPKARLVQ